jgi:hypothetical protein
MTSVCLAENLFENTEFDQPFTGECRIENTVEGHATVKRFTEDATWNNCARFELISINDGKNGTQSVAACVALGGDKQHLGFEVEPEATYEFSVELKGTAPTVYVKANAFTGPDIWKHRKNIKVDFKSPIHLSNDWQQYKGRFTTGADAKRVTFILQLWWDTQYGPMPYKVGDVFFIDKLVIQKATDPLKAFKTDTSTTTQVSKNRMLIAPVKNDPIVLDGKLDEKAWGDVEYHTGFYGLNNKSITQQTAFKVLADQNGLYLGVTCDEPLINQLKANVSTPGDHAIWQDDVLEIFFSPVVNDRKLSQFVLSPGGAKWRSIGDEQILKNDGWKQATAIHDKAWSAEVYIPYALLGWDKQPESGSRVGFNIARQRKPVGELSTWSDLDRTFHDVQNYGKMIIGQFDDYAAKQTALLEDQIKRLAPDQQKSLMGQMQSLKKAHDPVAFDQQYRQIQLAIEQATYRDHRFFVTHIPVTHAMQLPLIPSHLSPENKAIKERAAINDTKNIAIAITNVTDQTQEYRVLIHDGKTYGTETLGLFDEKGNAFPMDQIRLMRGVRVKDRDAGKVVQLFDPLVDLDEIQSVVSGSMDSALLWAQLDCTNVKPGKYKGFLRVIPLAEPAKVFLSPAAGNLKGWKYEGQMVDVPIEIEVLPFALSSEPAIPWDVMRVAFNESSFQTMVQQGVRMFMLTAWLIRPTFNPDGSIKSFDSRSFDKEIQRHIQWAKQNNVLDEIKWGLGLNCYGLFISQCGGKQFEVGSEQWERAWKNYVLTTAQAFQANGVSLKNVYMELLDEPELQMRGKRLTQQTLVNIYRLAKEASPDVQTCSWFDVHTPANGYPELLPYINAWGFYATALISPEHQALLQMLRKQGIEIWQYQCGTNTNADLYHYYRKHAWIAYHAQADLNGFFVYADPKEGGWAEFSWKRDPEGGVVYRSGDNVITSIRNECLKAGDRDTRYLKYLQQRLEKSDKQSQAFEAAKSFLEQATDNVLIKQSHDREQAEKTIQTIITHILSLNPAGSNALAN